MKRGVLHLSSARHNIMKGHLRAIERETIVRGENKSWKRSAGNLFLDSSLIAGTLRERISIPKTEPRKNEQIPCGDIPLYCIRRERKIKARTSASNRFSISISEFGGIEEETEGRHDCFSVVVSETSRCISFSLKTREVQQFRITVKHAYFVLLFPPNFASQKVLRIFLPFNFGPSGLEREQFRTTLNNFPLCPLKSFGSGRLPRTLTRSIAIGGGREVTGWNGKEIGLLFAGPRGRYWKQI